MALAARLGDRLQVGVETSLKRETGGWRVGGERVGTVIIAAPSYAAASLLRESAPPLAEALDTIAYNPMAGVHLLFRKRDMPRALDGFGFLVPRREKVRLLGCIWSSSLFDVCANEHVAVTCFMGGAHDPQAVTLTEAQLVAEATRDLKQTLQVTEAPVDASVIRIAKAIPAYGRQHLAQRDRILALAGQNDGLYLTGNYLEGVALTDAIAHAEKTALSVQHRCLGPRQAA